MKINTGHIFHITSYEIFKCKRYFYRGLFLSTKITRETTSTQLLVPNKHLRIGFIQVLAEPLCCAWGIFYSLLNNEWGTNFNKDQCRPISNNWWHDYCILSYLMRQTCLPIASPNHVIRPIG